MLELKNICKRIGKKEILKNICHQVQKGKFIAILGPSGCGKTTLLKTMAGLIRTTSGTVVLNNKVVAKPGEAGLVFQEYALFPWLTVEQNILFGSESSIKKNILQNYLDLSGLAKYRKYYPKQLSGGMKQRTAVLRTILSRSKIILMDEPFGALDVFNRQQMQNILLKLWKESGKTIIFVTHDIEEALFLADEVLIFSGSPSTIKAKITLTFERPRRENLRYSANMLKLRKKISKILKQ